jgi:exodeoxyribonuclease-3
MKLATWNVNSLNVRLPHLLDWLQSVQPDVVCLQETKLEDHKFPREAIEAAGYQVAFAGQKTYNGVALLSRSPLEDVVVGNPHFADDPQQRLIAATVDGMRVISAYVPNGQEVGSEKYAYKLDWLAALKVWLQEMLIAHPQLVLAGDFNIAPDDRDVHDPKRWAGKILCSDTERQAFQGLLDLGLVDSFRCFEQPEKTYSWWDYRMLGFQKNLGLRIDHVLLSTPLAERCSAAYIDRAPRKLERPSDHAPALAEFTLP